MLNKRLQSFLNNGSRSEVLRIKFILHGLHSPKLLLQEFFKAYVGTYKTEQNANLIAAYIFTTTKIYNPS